MGRGAKATVRADVCWRHATRGALGSYKETGVRLEADKRQNPYHDGCSAPFQRQEGQSGRGDVGVTRGSSALDGGAAGGRWWGWSQRWNGPPSLDKRESVGDGSRMEPACWG